MSPRPLDSSLEHGSAGIFALTDREADSVPTEVASCEVRVSGSYASNGWVGAPHDVIMPGPHMPAQPLSSQAPDCNFLKPSLLFAFLWKCIMGAHISGSQMTIWGRQSSPSTMWVPGMKLRLSGLACKHPYLLSHVTSPGTINVVRSMESFST